MNVGKNKVEELEKRLGYHFEHRETLVRALTHRSLANEAMQELPEETRTSAQKMLLLDNERLEFLGDAVLGLAVAEALFETHEDWHEGDLTRIRAQLVSRKHLAEVAEDLGLGEFLRLSKSEEKTGIRRKGTVLSNSMEAVIGALYLDGGLKSAKQFIARSVLAKAEAQLVAELNAGAALGNFKSALQEFVQSHRLGTPVYRLKSETGPDHRKNFHVEVKLHNADGINGNVLATGSGKTKKDAEQQAAQLALEKLIATEESGSLQEESE